MIIELNEMRPRMMSIAYRILGSIPDAEDAVQEAFLRLHTADDVTSPEGFLIKTTTRKCVDQVRANRRRRTYTGLSTTEADDTSSEPPCRVLSESLTQAFLVLMQRLSPDERSAFLLRTVFEYEYTQIAEVLQKTAVHVRQIVSRAKMRLAQGTVRFQFRTDDADYLAEQFVAACQVGDLNLVERLFENNVELQSESGATGPTARVVIRGTGRGTRISPRLLGKTPERCGSPTTT